MINMCPQNHFVMTTSFIIILVSGFLFIYNVLCMKNIKMYFNIACIYFLFFILLFFIIYIIYWQFAESIYKIKKE